MPSNWYASRVHECFSRASAACLGGFVLALSSCSAAVTPPERSVGPAPLRRLSDTEYLNALHDLFPAVEVALPALPHETNVAGFENAIEAQQPSDVRIARYEAIALIYAEALTQDTAAVQALTGCRDWSMEPNATACAHHVVETLGARLFRRPLENAERTRLLSSFEKWKAAIDFEAAVRLTVLALLQSPAFLYRPEPQASGLDAGSLAPVEAYAMASRLSFFLWESVPDDALLDAASKDSLRTLPEIETQARRMLADPRARRVLWSFHRWLGLDRVREDEHQVRTPEVDAAWTPQTQASSYEESRRFIEAVLSDDGSMKALFTSRRAFVDGEMARVYGLPAPLDPQAWAEVSLPAGERAGILTRVAFLAGTSHRGGTSPPIRGNAVQLRALCRLPAPPPPGTDLSMPTAPADGGVRTTRMLFDARTATAGCQACHRGLNGLGNGFENYSASGQWRTTERDLPIDARGQILGTDVDGTFTGAIALSDALARSSDVFECAAQQWVRYALGRAPVDAERPWTDALTKHLVASGNVRELLVEIVTAPSFRLRVAEAP